MRSQITCNVSLFLSVYTRNDSITDADIHKIDYNIFSNLSHFEMMQYCKENKVHFIPDNPFLYG